MKPQRRTIKDVAREAGFSVATVSDALNNKGRVAPATREHIISVANKLNYKASRVAKNLMSGETGSILLAVSPLANSERADGLQPEWDIEYYFRILNGASARAFKHGFLLSMVPFHTDSKAFIESADGLIVVDPSDDDELLDYALEMGISCVTIGKNSRQTSWVDNDFVQGTTDALTLLNDAHPALFLSETTSPYVRDELSAYLEWCLDHDVQPIILRSPGHRADEAVKVIEAALSDPDRKFNAVVTTLDTLAQATERSARQLGINVPEDLQIVSLTDSRYLDFGFQTAITALDLQPLKLGETAVDFAVDSIRGDRETRREIVSTTLHKRESTRE